MKTTARTRIRVACHVVAAAALVAATSGRANAIGISSAAGREDVSVAGSTAPAATVATCATADVGNVNGGLANFGTVFQPKNPNNACTNTFSRNGRPVAVFDGYGKIGPSAVAKYPGGLGSSLTVLMTLGGGMNPDTTLAQGSAGFVSSVTPTTIPGTNIVLYTTYASELSASAMVNKTTGKAPIGAASGVAQDPWFFTPTVSDTLTITVTLSDIDLEVSTSGGDSGFAEIQADGSFVQVDPSDPSDVIAVLASWSTTFTDTGGALTPPTQVELSGSFPVTPGDMYELTADLGGFATVPEPGSALLLAPCVVGVLARRRRVPASQTTEE